MADSLRTIDELDVEGRRVLLRADFNVPLHRPQPGGPVEVADDTRIRAALETIAELRARGARLVLVSHLGRPKGIDPALSMRPVADRLEELTGAPVTLAPAVTGPEVSELTERLAPGEMLMLENIRYEPGETRNDPDLVSALAELADVYVNDAFGTAHRAHASTEGIAHRLPSAAGRLMEREVRTLQAIVERPDRPLVAILGGAKVSDKIGVVERFLELADVLCIGGAMCFPFFAAQGHRVGASLCPEDDVEAARRALRPPRDRSCRLELPIDLVVAPDGQQEPARPRALDGSRRARRLERPRHRPANQRAATPPRSRPPAPCSGTARWAASSSSRSPPEPAPIAEAVASTPATTVVGGGETVEAMRTFGLADRVTHLSTGGGATLELLEGRELPGVHALMHTAVSAR